MEKTTSGTKFKHLFWAFTAGVTVALAISAGIALLITSAPIPFVSKVQQVESSIDEKLLDGKTIDPNKKLYAEGQGQEQTVGGEAVATTKTEASSAHEVATVGASEYFVQAGAFAQSADAENMRAQIAFIGLDSQVSYNRENGQRLYRVRIGPFETQSQADEIKQSLADNGIQGTVLNLPQ